MIWRKKSLVYSRSFCIEAQCLGLTAVSNISSAPNMTEETMTAVRGNLSQTAGASGQKDRGQTEPTNGAIPSSSPAELSQDSCTRELTRTWLQFAKTFVLIFPIYVLGYFEFSFSWLLIALTIFFFGKETLGVRTLGWIEHFRFLSKRAQLNRSWRQLSYHLGWVKLHFHW